MRRQLKATTIDGSTKVGVPLWFRAQLGKTLRARGSQGQVSDTGLHVHLAAPRKTNGVVRTAKELTEWIIPLEVKNGKTAWELIYRW